MTELDPALVAAFAAFQRALDRLVADARVGAAFVVNGRADLVAAAGDPSLLPDTVRLSLGAAPHTEPPSDELNVSFHVMESRLVVSVIAPPELDPQTLADLMTSVGLVEHGVALVREVVARTDDLLPALGESDLDRLFGVATD